MGRMKGSYQLSLLTIFRLAILKEKYRFQLQIKDKLKTQQKQQRDTNLQGISS